MQSGDWWTLHIKSSGLPYVQVIDYTLRITEAMKLHLMVLLLVVVISREDP